MNFAQNEQFTIKKAGGLSVVLLVHAGLIGALVYGLHYSYVTREKHDHIDVTLPPPLEKPFEPPVKVEQPKPQTYKSDFIPFPEVVINQANTNTTIVDHTGTPNPGPTTPTPKTLEGPQTAPTPHVAANSPARAELENCKPVYPASSARAEEEGTVRVRFEIGPDNHLLSASLVKSSGYPKLDSAALNALSQCSFKAAVQNGAPVTSSFVTDYVWSLN